MRRMLILISVAAVAVACAKKEQAPAADTSAPVAAAPAAPAVVAVTDAEVSGTWKGTSSPMTSDSVVSHWTEVCAAGKCTGTSTESPKVTVHATYTLAGDSAVGKSEPYADPSMKELKGAKIIDMFVVHFNGDNASGTGVLHLASKPDSIVMAYKFAGTKQH